MARATRPGAGRPADHADRPALGQGQQRPGRPQQLSAVRVRLTRVVLGTALSAPRDCVPVPTRRARKSSIARLALPQPAAGRGGDQQQGRGVGVHLTPVGQLRLLRRG